MKHRITFTLIALSVTLSAQAFTQVKEYGVGTTFAERNLGGPRLGITYVPGNTTLVEKLRERGIGSSISQFGWHFEYQIIPEGGGPSFVIQAIPMVGGVEYGTLIPTGTIAMGVRLPDGYEFGMGPNMMFGGPKGVATALVVALGKSVDYGGVSIPLNFVFATNPEGNRFSIIFGYAIAKGLK
ncbi:MAG: hypothetical protein HY562_04575 [Ignavibacteriales bacterium]|nr:hypothetical protein [Ignavibacteriales bacterium]